MRENPRIVGVAIKHGDGRTLSMPRPFRHDAVIYRAVRVFEIEGIDSKWSQGFVDQYGKFHDRKQAIDIAIQANQTDGKDIQGGILMSEDLW